MTQRVIVFIAIVVVLVVIAMLASGCSNPQRWRDRYDWCGEIRPPPQGCPQR